VHGFVTFVYTCCESTHALRLAAGTLPPSLGRPASLSKGNTMNPLLSRRTGLIAALALASGDYLMPIMNKVLGSDLPQFTPKIVAISLILLVTVIQLGGVVTGGLFQNIITSIKLLFIVVLIISPFFFLACIISFFRAIIPSFCSYDCLRFLNCLHY
jgi:hypothetical protein